MPELRQNIATKEWVIIAKERAQRPHQFMPAAAPRKDPPAKDPKCPFCPGNDHLSETTFIYGELPDWKVRVVKNKFPALVPNAPKIASTNKLYRTLPGEGVHEVIIETPRHDKTLALLEPAQVRDVLVVYQERFKACLQSTRVAMPILFKNHGESAGTSLEHPHSQLIASSVVPSNIRHRMDEAEKYFEQNDACVFCRMLEEEKRENARIVAETPHFIAFVLFAALSPFHMWILPKRHTPSFDGASLEELQDLAGLLRDLLKRIHKALGNPSYNYIVQSAPLDRGNTKPYHWYISLVLRLGKAAGFELGSGMFINPLVPEEAAEFLNSVKP